MKQWSQYSILALLALMALSPRGAEAQAYGSVAGGVAAPAGDFGDLFETGYTARGQVGFSLVLLDVHLQAGWTRFPGKEIEGSSTGDDANIYHAGVGARVGLGVIFVGANAAHFFGDGDSGIGFFPEVGVSLWRLEAVADYRFDGDQKWFGVRLGLKL